MSKKKQHKAPKKWATKVSPKTEVSFNLAQMVHNYAMLKRLIGLFEQTRDNEGRQLHPESTDFFSGVIKGYDDWFDALGVDQDKFNMVFEKLDKSNIIADADATYIRILEGKKESVEQQKKEARRVILPGDKITRQDVSIAKQIFDQQLSKLDKK